jgi:hypothetical protein
MSDLDTLSKIIPPDQALSNKALARSLQQVKGVFNSSTQELAPALAELEGIEDLSMIAGLEQPVPDDVVLFVNNTVATGTGPGNIVLLDDVIGVAAGTVVSSTLNNVTQGLQLLANAGVLDPLSANTGDSTSSSLGIYPQMEYALAGAYGNVSGGNITIPATDYWPGGEFANIDVAFSDGLIPAANFYIASIAQLNPEITATINDAYSAAATELALNVENCERAGIDLATLVLDPANAGVASNSTSSVLGFASGLHEYGTDVNGAAAFLERVCDKSTMTGQAVIASMREGRNIQRLNDAGVQIDTQIPPQVGLASSPFAIEVPDFVLPLIAPRPVAGQPPPPPQSVPSPRDGPNPDAPLPPPPIVNSQVNQQNDVISSNLGSRFQSEPWWSLYFNPDTAQGGAGPARYNQAFLANFLEILKEKEYTSVQQANQVGPFGPGPSLTYIGKFFFNVRGDGPGNLLYIYPPGASMPDPGSPGVPFRTLEQWIATLQTPEDKDLARAGLLPPPQPQPSGADQLRADVQAGRAWSVTP